jgi:predicted RNA-binding protein YlxR (DUF448 family)
MNTGKKTTTQIRTESFFSNIITKFGHSTFTWDELDKFQNITKTEKMAVSMAVKTGDLIRIDRGVYVMKNMNAEDIAKKCRALSANLCAKMNKSKKQQEQLSIPTEIVTHNHLTEEICAKFLKARGYKVMKPITTFKEI